jgi:hypothetical protein
MITIVFTTKAAFDVFRQATPATDENPFTKIGEPAYETADPQTGVPSPTSRVFVAHHFTADEAEYLQSRGADVRLGGPSGPVWPGPQNP